MLRRSSFVVAASLLLAGCAQMLPEAQGFTADASAGGEMAMESAAFDAPAPMGMAMSRGAFKAGPAMEAATVTPVDVAQADRKIVYNADLSLRVPNKANAAKEAERIVAAKGGFISDSSLDHITFRVPPESLREIIAGLEQLGDVLSRDITSEDVTTQFIDTKLRLEVAEKSLARLYQLLDRADKTSDVLEIERDIRRLTEEIESMKGSLRELERRVATARLTVRFSENPPPAIVVPRRTANQFGWINGVGVAQALKGVPPWARTVGPALFWGFKIDVPEGFVVLSHYPSELIAATPGDTRLRVTKWNLSQEPELAFWSEALEIEFREYRGYQVTAAREFAMQSANLRAHRIDAETTHNGVPWRYSVWLLQRAGDKDELVIVEFAQPLRDGTDFSVGVDAAVKGLRTR